MVRRRPLTHVEEGVWRRWRRGGPGRGGGGGAAARRGGGGGVEAEGGAPGLGVES